MVDIPIVTVDGLAPEGHDVTTRSPRHSKTRQRCARRHECVSVCHDAQRHRVSSVRLSPTQQPAPLAAAAPRRSHTNCRAMCAGVCSQQTVLHDKLARCQFCEMRYVSGYGYVTQLKPILPELTESLPELTE